MPRQLNALQAGRAFAAISVVLFHTNDVLRLPKYLGHEVEPIFRSGSSGVAFFFVLSGFVIYLAHHRDFGHATQVGRFAEKRFKRVYLPLWCMLFLVIPVYFLVPSFGKGGERSPLNLLLAFLIAPAPYERVLTPEWTLRHEILFYGFFAATIWKRRLGLILLIGWFVLSAVLPWTHPNFPLGFFFAANHLAFAFGMLACILYSRYEMPGVAAKITAILGCGVYAAAWGMRCLNPDQLPRAVDLLFALGTALLILGFVNIERRGELKVLRPLVFLGEASYSIYLVHHPALSLFSKLFSSLRHRPLDGVIFWSIALLSILCGLVFHMFVERPLLAYANRGKLKPAHA